MKHTDEKGVTHEVIAMTTIASAVTGYVAALVAEHPDPARFYALYRWWEATEPSTWFAVDTVETTSLKSMAAVGLATIHIDSLSAVMLKEWSALKDRMAETRKMLDRNSSIVEVLIAARCNRHDWHTEILTLRGAVSPWQLADRIVHADYHALLMASYEVDHADV